MFLHSGNLFWPTTYTPKNSFPALQEDEACDVLVIGGGITGSLCSYQLSLYGLDTILVDKHTIGSGSTSASSGILQFVNNRSLSGIASEIGDDQAIRYYKMCWKAVDEIGRIMNDLDERVPFKRRNSVYFANNSRDSEWLEKEFDRLTKIGFPVQYLENEQLKSVLPTINSSAIWTKNDAEINPYHFVHALIDKAITRKLRVYENTEINDHLFGDDIHSFSVGTYTIKAKHVIYATGCETQNFAKSNKVKLNHTYTVVTEPVEDLSMWKEQCLIRETRRPYFYMRTYNDRIIAGGLDKDNCLPKKDKSTLKEKEELLREQITDLFPDIQPTIEYSWIATFAETKDGLPLIGVHPKYDRVYFCLSYGRSGLLNSMFGSEILKDLIMYGQHPDAEIIQLNR